MGDNTNESFWRFAYKIRYESRITPAQSARESLFLRRFLPHVGDILDFACGYGRHANLLSRSGLKMHGFDNDVDAIKKARSESRKLFSDSRPSYVRKNLLKFDKRERYDGAICMYSSIGTLSEKDNIILFRNLLRSVKRGGTVILDLMNPAWVSRNIQPMARKKIEYKDKVYTLVHRRYLRARPLREVNQIDVSSAHSPTTSYSYSLRLYTRPEVNYILKRFSFKATYWYGSFAMNPVSPHHQRLIVIATHMK